MRIRVRLALFGAVVISVAMIVFGVLISLLAQQTAPEDQNKDLANLVEAAATQLAGQSAADLPEDPPVQIDLSVSTEAFIAIVDEAGRNLYSTGQAGGEPPAVPASVIVEALERGQSSVTYRPITDVEINVHARPWERAEQNQRGVVIAGQSTAVVEEALQGLTALAWIVGIITTLAAIVVGWLVAGRALRPLRELAETTEEIRETDDLSRRLPPARNAKDEVGVLTRSFNGMLEGLESTRHDLSNSLASQRRFVADASHELRSPLTTIRNNAEFLAERPDASDVDRREAVGDIVSEGERMSDLINDLLILASVDAGREVEHQPVDLGSLAHDVVRKRPEVSIDTPGKAVIAGDPASLTRLLVILLDNAAKYGRSRTEVSVHSDNGHVTLSVADDGDGIPTDEADRLFERFYRADPARTNSGFGLGLAIAREIVAAHGGEINGANRPEGGAVFTATFPAA